MIIEFFIYKFEVMDTTQTNDVNELMKLSLTTFLNIVQMTHFRVCYLTGKELQNESSAYVSASELTQNRDKMIFHTCLAGLGIIGLFAFGIAGLISKK